VAGSKHSAFAFASWVRSPAPAWAKQPGAHGPTSLVHACWQESMIRSIEAGGPASFAILQLIFNSQEQLQRSLQTLPRSYAIRVRIVRRFCNLVFVLLSFIIK